MKIYLFNPESGVYLGEDFADEAMEEGAYRLPSDATTIAPPKVEPAHLAVFNAARQQWEVHRRPAKDASTAGEERSSCVENES